jgi:general secretion pathway protein D
VYRWQRTDRALRAAAGALTLAMALGCATQQAANQGEKAIATKNWDAAVYHYLEALAGDPENVEYRMGLVHARQKAAQEHFQRGQNMRELGRLSQARDEMTLAIQLDPTQQFAEQELEAIQKELDILEEPGGAAALEDLKRKAREAKVKPPALNPASKDPITLSFPKQKPVKEIYQAIGKAYGFNVLFDPKLKDDKLSIDLAQVTAQQALEIVMQAAGHFYKVIDEHSIIVIEDTPQNRREYEDLVIKTFFLSNADVKDVDKLLRSLIEARRLASNEQLNAITLRDTADKVAIAEKLINTNDKAKAEVVVDVELMLVTTAKNSDLGAVLSSYSFSLSLDHNGDGTTDTSLPIDEIGAITRGDWFVNVPTVIINLVKNSGLAEVLAEPQLRVTEGEKASLHIGDRVPIPVTSFNTQYAGSTGVTPITSFQYQDVGIKIEVEPRVHHNREVTLKLTVEVSNLGEQVPVGPSQTAVTIGTRTITSVIRLHSGESSLLAGLIRHDRAEGKTETPILSDIPIIGQLFTRNVKKDQTTDLVLTLTPHIVRFPDIQEEDLAPIWVGTESRVSFSGSSSPRVQSGRASQGPFDSGEEEPPPEEPEEKKEPEKVDKPGAPPSRPRPTPFGFKQPVTPGGLPGMPPDGQKSLGLETAPDQGTSDGTKADNGTLEPRPLILTVEPSVISLHPGEETVLQLVAAGGKGSLRLPVGLTYDPKRVAVVGVEPAPAVEIQAESNAGDGWLALDLVVNEAGEMPQVLAAVRLRGLEPGPAPLQLSAANATDGDGSALPVAAHDGALFVLGAGGDPP